MKALTFLKTTTSGVSVPISPARPRPLPQVDCSPLALVYGIVVGLRKAPGVSVAKYTGKLRLAFSLSYR